MSDTAKLATLVQQKHDVLSQLHALATRQLTLAEEGDSGVMISLIATKQGFIDALMAIEKALAPYRSESPDERVWKSQEERARVAALSQECNELLNELMSLDRLGLERVQARQQQTKIQIDSAHQAASARTAYLTTAPSTPQSIDIASNG